MVIQEGRTPISNVFKQGDAVIKHGIVLPDEHPTDPSLYKVNIGDVTASDNGRIEDGIWCTNNITPYTRFRDINNNPVSYGQYFPLLPYMPVTVMIPAGGAGQGMVIAPAKTNVGLPDPENRDDLYMAMQTPKGSWIAANDKTGNIQIFYENGNSSVTLSDNNITLEIGKGAKSGKEHGTSLSITNGSFIFRTKDSTMKFDESGLSVGFDADEGQEKSSNFSLTRDSVRMQAGKNMQFNAQDSISSKAEKVTLQGSKDASISANHVKVNGAQLTSIKGTQIELEAFWNLQMKGMHIGTQATVLQREISVMKHSKNIVQLEESNGIAVQQTTARANWNLSANMVFSTYNGMFPKPKTSGAFLAIGAYAGTKAACEATHKSMAVVGILWMTKTLPIAIITNVLGTGVVMAAAGNRSENPSVFLFNARDSKNKKSINAGIATSYANKNRAMENICVVDPLIQASMSAATCGGVSPSASVSPNSNLLAGVAGIQESNSSVVNTSRFAGASSTTQPSPGIASMWNRNLRKR